MVDCRGNLRLSAWKRGVSQRAMLEEKKEKERRSQASNFYFMSLRDLDKLFFWRRAKTSSYHVTWSRSALNSPDEPTNRQVHFWDGIKAPIEPQSPFLFSRLVRSLRAVRPVVEMITKFVTEITAKFNPFSACAKPARLFLTFLPPNARANGTSITTTLLPRNSTEASSLKVKFSMWPV